MDLLHDVEGDGHDAAGVLAHRHPPARGDRGRVTPLGGRCGGSPGDARGSPRPGLVGLEEDEEGGLVVAVEELHVDDVEELLVQLPHVDDVAGQEAGLLPGGGERGGGERLRTPPPAPTGGRGGGGLRTRGVCLPLSHQPLVLVGEGVAAEGQDHQAGAVDQHDGAAPIGVHPHPGDVDVLHEAVLRDETVGRRQKSFGGIPLPPQPTPIGGNPPNLPVSAPTLSSGSSK